MLKSVDSSEKVIGAGESEFVCRPVVVVGRYVQTVFSDSSLEAPRSL